MVMRPFYLVAVATVCALLIPLNAAETKSTNEPFIEALQAEVDALLKSSDSVELRKRSPAIFNLATRLLQANREKEARFYLEKGLSADPWALAEQLTLGEILARSGSSEAGKDRATMVLRVGEDDKVLRRASSFLGQPLPREPEPFSKFREKEQALLLVPIGGISAFALADLKEALSKSLQIRVEIASLDIPPPTPDRSEKDQWVVRTREQILGILERSPRGKAELRQLGFDVESIRNRNDAVVDFVRKTSARERGRDGVREFEAMLATLEANAQYDAEKVLGSLQTAVHERATSTLMVLGVLTEDLFGGKANFVFGSAATGKFAGIVSAARFKAAFTGEAPNRERLGSRLLKQSLSTIGFMMGVERCNTPECARAYPQSLAEHDQKPSTLCVTCGGAFAEKLNRSMPER